MSFTRQIQNSWNQLKPLERRWAVGGGSLVFLLFNYFFIWPHLGDYSINKRRIQTSESTNAFFMAEINRKAEYQSKLSLLQSGGEDVPPEDQAIDFVHFLDSRAVNNGVVITTHGQLITHTNDYFVEQQMGINVQAYETNMVKFLYSLGSGGSMMRVRSMTIHPEPNHFQINVNLTLVASYQKKVTDKKAVAALADTSARRVAQPAPATAPASKPAPVLKPGLGSPPKISPPGLGAPQNHFGTNRPPRFFDRGSRTNRPPSKAQP